MPCRRASSSPWQCSLERQHTARVAATQQMHRPCFSHLSLNCWLQSELPFRMLCRAHGAQAAYTPMLHARLFLDHQHYRCVGYTLEAVRHSVVVVCSTIDAKWPSSVRIRKQTVMQGGMLGLVAEEAHGGVSSSCNCNSSPQQVCAAGSYCPKLAMHTGMKVMQQPHWPQC
jgi:hypothetical protein